ncbi:MAG TPA: DUF192 domain-containing protein [Rubrobacteraceae bacterium]|nr:DUF192 domain-containing protein [Rubrobacteraceae bacterium]
MLAVLTLGALLVAATSALAQSEVPPGLGTPAATQPQASQLPVSTIVNSLGERIPVQVEIADTAAERQTGLSGRPTLAEDAGMLFVFDQEQPLSFWMKDTLIPLSIAYISTEGRIVDIQDMQPLDETPHPSAEPAQYALEVNQGFFAERGVAVGDMVELPGQGMGESMDPTEVPVTTPGDTVSDTATIGEGT